MDINYLPQLMNTIRSAINCARTGGKLGSFMMHCVANDLRWKGLYDFTWRADYDDGTFDSFTIYIKDADALVVEGNFFIPDPNEPLRSRYFTIRGGDAVRAYQTQMDQMLGNERYDFSFRA